MKRLLFAIICLVAWSPVARAQTLETTVCDVLANPVAFDGKIVQVKGTAIAGFDEFLIKDPACKGEFNAIWLSYPAGTQAKAGPVALLQMQIAANNPVEVQAKARPAVTLVKDEAFRKFDRALSTAFRGDGICPGCVRYAANATFVGRLDGVGEGGVGRRQGRIVAVKGFGALNAYRARLVLQSVADVVPVEIVPAAASPQAAAQAPAWAASPFPQASRLPATAQAYGGPGEDNGVNVTFGTANEVAADDGEKGKAASPDGVLYVCTFAGDRLKGDAMGLAMAHLGSHLLDVRGNAAENMAIPAAEYRAWQTTILQAVALKQKTLGAPGGFLVWSSKWPAGDAAQMGGQAIASFISSWFGLVP